MRADSDLESLFTAVLVEGTEEAVASWIGFGPSVMPRLRQELAGERHISVPVGTSQRDLLDNLMVAAYEAARVFPEEFLASFAEDRWDGSPAVCSGLGAIRRPEVTARLLRILKSGDLWRRVDAAVALRGHRHPDLKEALQTALQDPEYLVRYHAQERLDDLASE
jgi:hypothetical protein